MTNKFSTSSLRKDSIANLQAKEIKVLTQKQLIKLKTKIAMSQNRFLIYRKLLFIAFICFLFSSYSKYNKDENSCTNKICNKNLIYILQSYGERKSLITTLEIIDGQGNHIKSITLPLNSDGGEIITQDDFYYLHYNQLFNLDVIKYTKSKNLFKKIANFQNETLSNCRLYDTTLIVSLLKHNNLAFKSSEEVANKFKLYKIKINDTQNHINLNPIMNLVGGFGRFDLSPNSQNLIFEYNYYDTSQYKLSRSFIGLYSFKTKVFKIIDSISSSDLDKKSFLLLQHSWKNDSTVYYLNETNRSKMSDDILIENNIFSNKKKNYATIKHINRINGTFNFYNDFFYYSYQNKIYKYNPSTAIESCIYSLNKKNPIILDLKIK